MTLPDLSINPSPVYLDYNATAPLRAEAAAAITEALGVTGNPSSVHRFGRSARAVVEEARVAIAGVIGASVDEIIFTSGGSEANALALRGAPVRSLVVSAIEHPSVLENAKAGGLPCAWVGAGSNGQIDLGQLDQALTQAPAPALAVIMLANNETGVIQPIAEAVALARRHGALILCDAVQAFGKWPVDFRAIDVDFLSLSAHKLGGPQGVGALVARAGLALRPQLLGGGQERRRRAGTENVAGTAGFAAAALAAKDDQPILEQIKGWRDEMERTLKVLAPDLRIYGGDTPRLPTTSCFGLAGIAAETLVMALDLAGIAVSAGSACSSGKIEPSRVLGAMGVDDISARSAIRVSFGWASGANDAARLVEAWRSHWTRVRDRAA
jgi:cysteine desulfurase